MWKRLSLSPMIAVCVFGACGDKEDPRGKIAECAEQEPQSYLTNALPIFEFHCLRCHHSGLSGADRNGANPVVNFDTYIEATADIVPTRSVPEAMLDVLRIGAMPADGTTKVSKAELCTLEAWVVQGTPP